ncbi:hypothetical protein SELMODRAFT_427648 [Selaginella moellendorffii]|uniref:Major facilitator superfamily (MFS) profile domain-containing protein n=2 Tax=Selaginella moellendorffii TaxID=88036 RepID=D8T0A1_SELML|nr:hypothetical protein SELMODRAFT_427648 [Selaginella moellendorffii]
MDWRMSLALNAAAMMERADEALVPAVYSEIAAGFGIGPSALGWLTFVRALVQALASPLAAYLAMTYNRAHIVGLGALVWGAATAGVGISRSYWQAVIARAVNGIGLAVVVPAIQSLVADSHKEESRGLAFGWLHASGQLGTVFGGVFATLLAGTNVFSGVPGWRVAFFIVALLSVLLGIIVYAIVKDPTPPRSSGNCTSVSEKTKEMIRGTRSVLSLRTFQVIVAQGVVGQTPWNAMVFFTLWLELLGFGHARAALCVALLSIGNAFGSVFGGWVGDVAAAKFPNAGRIACSQFSAGVGIPLSALLLLGLPSRPSFAWAYGLVLYAMGFLMSWNSPATNWPIFSEIVPAELRTTVYALDMALEKSVAAVGSPLVGILSEVFGFSSKPDGGGGANARAMARGLFLCIAVPFVACIAIISALYVKYPVDRDAARVNREYVKLEVDDEDRPAVAVE